MKLNIKKFLIIITTIIPSVMIAVGGAAKLIAVQGVVQMLSKVGVEPYIPFLGFAEIVFTALFIIRRTRRLGFTLLCCYFGGAVATVISHQGSFFGPALIPLVLIWINMLLREGSVFILSKNER